jgi:hypothetical protein
VSFEAFDVKSEILYLSYKFLRRIKVIGTLVGVFSPKRDARDFLASGSF